MAGFRDTAWPYHSGSDFRLEVLTFAMIGLGQVLCVEMISCLAA